MTAEQIRHARDLLTRPDNTVSSIARLLGVSRATYRCQRLWARSPVSNPLLWTVGEGWWGCRRSVGYLLVTRAIRWMAGRARKSRRLYLCLWVASPWLRRHALCADACSDHERYPGNMPGGGHLVQEQQANHDCYARLQGHQGADCGDSHPP